MQDNITRSDDRFTANQRVQLEYMAAQAECEYVSLRNTINGLPGSQAYWETDYMAPNQHHPAGTLHVTHPTFEDGAYAIFTSASDADGEVVFHVAFSDTTDHVHSDIENASFSLALQHLFEVCLRRRQSPSYSDRVSMLITRIEGLFGMRT